MDFIHSMCFNPFYHYVLCPNCLLLGQWGPLKVVPAFFFFSSCFLLTDFLVFDSFLATWQEKGYLMHFMPLTRNQPFLHGVLVPFNGEWHLKTRVWVVRVDLLLSRSLRLHWEEQESRRTEWIYGDQLGSYCSSQGQMTWMREVVLEIGWSGWT